MAGFNMQKTGVMYLFPHSLNASQNVMLETTDNENSFQADLPRSYV